MTPLFQIINRITRLPLRLQVAHLEAILKVEPPHSRRRRELLGLLTDRKARLIRQQTLAERRRA